MGARGGTCNRFFNLCCRSLDVPILTRSYMKLRPCQLPLPLSGPNMGCVHKMSTCTAASCFVQWEACQDPAVGNPPPKI